MEGVKLAEQEQTYYGELFQNCDIEGSGKVTGSKASDLFRLSGLSQDVLLQVGSNSIGSDSINVIYHLLFEIIDLKPFKSDMCVLCVHALWPMMKSSVFVV